MAYQRSLLHFSCHGVKDAQGRLHLAARDTDLSVLGASSVPASFVHNALDETQSRRVVLILDCCYSGAFTRGTAVRSGNEVHIADAFGASSGRVVLTASSATEYAFEGRDLTQRADAQPSVFTAALVDGMESGAADLDADGEISIDELYEYTHRRVRARTPGQSPMKWSFGVEGSLVVARSVRPAALPRSVMDDLASDRVVLRLEAVRALTQLSNTGNRGSARWRSPRWPGCATPTTASRSVEPRSPRSAKNPHPPSSPTRRPRQRRIPSRSRPRPSTRAKDHSRSPPRHRLRPAGRHRRHPPLTWPGGPTDCSSPADCWSSSAPCSPQSPSTGSAR